MDLRAYNNGYMSKFSAEPTDAEKMRDILMIHGWNSSPRALRKLKKQFEEEGRGVHVLDYSNDRLPAKELVRRKVVPFLKEHKDADIVTHSTGGLLTRLAAQGRNRGLLKDRRVLMVAPPMRGSYLSNLNDFLLKQKTGGLHNRPLLHDLRVGNPLFNTMKPVEDSDIAIMTGGHPERKNSLLDIYLKYIGADELKGGAAKKRDAILKNIYDIPSDGVVPIEHTRIPEERARYSMEDYDHTRLIRKKEAINKIVDYMRTGKF